MLLDELVGVIEALKQRIRTHGATLRANEIRTRVALIDPLLVALGWDVSDPALVTPEYAVGEGRADYALHGSESIPAAMVEAKRLGHSLSDDERMQMLNYANARGVRYAAVTDGDVWEFYEVFKQAPLEDRRLLNLRIANTPAHELALRLLLLWRPNLASGQPVTANEPVLVPFIEPDNGEDVAPVSSDATKAPTEGSPTDRGPARPTASPATSTSEWLPLANWNPSSGTSAPQLIRFSDGSEKPVGRWTQLLMAAGEWLQSTGKLAPVPKPILNGRTEKVLDVDPSGFRAPRRILDTDFHLNAHGNAQNLRDKTRALLRACGEDPSNVRVRA